MNPKQCSIFPQLRDPNNSRAQDSVNCILESYDCQQGNWFYASTLAQVRLGLLLACKLSACPGRTLPA